MTSAVLVKKVRAMAYLRYAQMVVSVFVGVTAHIVQMVVSSLVAAPMSFDLVAAAPMIPPSLPVVICCRVTLSQSSVRSRQMTRLEMVSQNFTLVAVHCPIDVGRAIVDV